MACSFNCFKFEDDDAFEIVCKMRHSSVLITQAIANHQKLKEIRIDVITLLLNLNKNLKEIIFEYYGLENILKDTNRDYKFINNLIHYPILMNELPTHIKIIKLNIKSTSTSYLNSICKLLKSKGIYVSDIYNDKDFLESVIELLEEGSYSRLSIVMYHDSIPLSKVVKLFINNKLTSYCHFNKFVYEYSLLMENGFDDWQYIGKTISDV